MNDFPQGAKIFFRMVGPDGNLIAAILPTLRTISCESEISSWMTARDEKKVFLGFFPKEFISAILPLETVGPSSADSKN